MSASAGIAELICLIFSIEFSMLNVRTSSDALAPPVAADSDNSTFSIEHSNAASRGRLPPAFSTRSTCLRRPSAAVRHSSSGRRDRRLNGSSHRCRRFGAGPPPHSQNRRRRVACPSYTLGSAWDTIFVFGRAHRLQTSDMNSCPPLRLTRFRHNRTESGSALTRYKSHCISRNCPFKDSTVRSKSTSRSVPKDFPTVNIMSSLLSLAGC